MICCSTPPIFWGGAAAPGLKYESDGGPGIGAIMGMRLGSERSAEDRRDFMRTQILFWMLAAIDGHGGAWEKPALPVEGDPCLALARNRQAVRLRGNESLIQEMIAKTPAVIEPVRGVVPAEFPAQMLLSAAGKIPRLAWATVSCPPERHGRECELSGLCESGGPPNAARTALAA